MTALQVLDARIAAMKKRAKAGHLGAPETLANLLLLRPWVKSGHSVRTAYRRLHQPVPKGKQMKIPRSIWDPILRPGLELPLTKAAMSAINEALRSAWNDPDKDFPGPVPRSTLERWRAKLS